MKSMRHVIVVSRRKLKDTKKTRQLLFALVGKALTTRGQGTQYDKGWRTSLALSRSSELSFRVSPASRPWALFMAAVNKLGAASGPFGKVLRIPLREKRKRRRRLEGVTVRLSPAKEVETVRGHFTGMRGPQHFVTVAASILARHIREHMETSEA